MTFYWYLYTDIFNPARKELRSATPAVTSLSGLGSHEKQNTKRQLKLITGSKCVEKISNSAHSDQAEAVK